MVATLLLTAAAGTGSLIYNQYVQATATAERDAVRFTTVLSSDVGGRLLSTDAVLIEIGQDIERLLMLAQRAETADAFAVARDDAQAAILRRVGLIAEMEALTILLRDRSLAGLGVGGWRDAESRDHPSLQAFVENPELRLRIDAPVTDPATGTASVVVARRIDRADGTLAGVVAARLGLRVFGSTVTMAQLNPRDIVSVWRRDGVLLARFPTEPSMLGRDFSGYQPIRRCLDAEQVSRGQFVSPFSQRRYFASCIQVPGFPLTVAVGIDFVEAMAAWRMSSLWLAVEIALVTALIVWLAIRASRRYVSIDQESDDNRELLRSVIDTLPAVITVKDADLRFKLVNGPFADMFGLRPEDCVGRRLADLIADPELVALSEQDDRAILATRQARRSAEWTYRPAGREPVHYVAFRRPRLDAGGRVRDIIAVSVDVTSMRQAQERLAESRRLLQTIVDAVPVLIMVKDRQARYLMINHTAADYYALTAERAYGRTTREISRPNLLAQLGDADHREAALAELERTDAHVLATGQAIPPYQVHRLDKDGRSRIHLTHKVALTDERGGVAGVVTVAVDVTELKESQRAALEAKEMAEFANRAKSEFLANMSHELRTPLNAVIGFGQMMEMQAFGALGHARYRDYAHHVVESGNHLLSLIGDILDVSSIDLGRVELGEEPVELSDVARTCLMLLRDKITTGGIMVETDGIDGLPALRGDRRRLLQILTNLVGNAIKFTPPGGHVRIVAGLETDGALRLAVSDTGIGMDPKDIETALEPFKQVDSVFVKRYGGTGLGLPIARRLATLHGADFSVRSALGAGTTVEIRFPAARVLAHDLVAAAVGRA